ncbi:NACHT domain-containing protein [Microbispora siamensis]|nr:NACHT domain-containing protein [Microbispora siamensis]
MKLLPALKVGDVDPVGAAIGSVSLVVALVGVYLAALAQRPPAPTLAEAVDQLARAVAARETDARRQLLGGHDRTIDVAFDFRPSPAHLAAGAGRHSRLNKVVDYYHRLSPRRMVVTGAPGAGKTVLAVELILGLIEARDAGDAVPVRITAASLDTELPIVKAVEQWLRRHLRQVYQLTEATARVLVENRQVTPVIDGLDEMDTGERPGYGSRAAHVLLAVNAYQHGRAKAAVILTCRTAQYEALEELRVWAHDAARVEIAPVDGRQARNFLTARATDPARWEPVLTAIERASRGPLAQGLSTPWRLTLAATVYDQRDSAGGFVRAPAELATIGTTPERVRDHLLGVLIPAAAALTPPPGGADVERVHRWLAVLARYLNTNATTGRTLGGRTLSGTDLVLHELWPLAGNRPRLVSIAIIVAGTLAGAALMLTWGGFSPFRLAVTGAYTATNFMSVWVAWRAIWPRTKRVDLRRLRTPASRRQLAVGLGSVLVVALGFALAVGIRAGLAVGVMLVSGLVFGFVNRLVFRFTEGVVGVSGPLDPVRADLASGLVFGLVGGLLLGQAVGLAVAFTAGVAVGLVFGLVFALMFGLAGSRYVALLACTRRWNAIWLPWRLGRFLNWAYEAGLLRIAGIAYQFRHRELQDYLATHPLPDPATARS